MNKVVKIGLAIVVTLSIIIGGLWLYWYVLASSPTFEKASTTNVRNVRSAVYSDPDCMFNPGVPRLSTPSDIDVYQTPASYTGKNFTSWVFINCGFQPAKITSIRLTTTVEQLPLSISVNGSARSFWGNRSVSDAAVWFAFREVANSSTLPTLQPLERVSVGLTSDDPLTVKFDPKRTSKRISSVTLYVRTESAEFGSWESSDNVDFVSKLPPPPPPTIVATNSTRSERTYSVQATITQVRSSGNVSVISFTPAIPSQFSYPDWSVDTVTYITSSGNRTFLIGQIIEVTVHDIIAVERNYYSDGSSGGLDRLTNRSVVSWRVFK